MTQIQGKRVLVTGGAQGIGRKMAETFAARGATIILTDIQDDVLKQTAAEMHATGATVSTYVMDVTKPDEVAEVRERINADLGPVEILVNNAGIVHGGVFTDVPLAKHLFTYQVNTIGLVAVTHTFLPDILDQAEGHVVNIASASGMVGLPYGTTYASSKWAALGFSESLRLELEHQEQNHVHVSTICPSYISTGMFHGVRAPALTKILEPQEVADMVVDAVAKNTALVLAPPIVKLIPMIKGLLPRGLAETLQWRLGVNTSMRHWQGHEGQ